MLADLAILESAWENLHPGLYRYNSQKDIHYYFTNLKEKCKMPLDKKTFYLRLSQLVQKIKCGHTFLNPLNMDSVTQTQIFPGKIIPFFFEVAENKLIITHVISSDTFLERGDEIVAINHIPGKEIMDSLLTVSRSDGRNALGKKLNNINESPDEAYGYSLFDIYFPLFFPTLQDSIQLTVRKFSGKTVQSANIALITLKERIYRYENRYGRLPVDENSWDYKLLNPGTAYMKFGTFAFWNSSFNAKGYIDSVFKDLLHHTHVTHLIIDIRGNEGGASLGDYILGYITEKKIGCDDPDRACYRYLRVPDSLLPCLDTWDNAFKQPKDPAKFFKNEIGLYELKNGTMPCDFIIPMENRFTGNVYLLINAKNSSAGFEMARNFKTAGLGTLVGETTGGTQQGLNGGEMFFLTLPNSKFEIDLPLIYNYHKNKPDRGIKPHYEIKTTQSHIHYGQDAQLNYALHLINKK